MNLLKDSTNFHEKKNLTFFFKRTGLEKPIEEIKLNHLFISQPSVREGLDQGKPKWEVFAPTTWPKYGSGDFCSQSLLGCMFVGRYITHEQLYTVAKQQTVVITRELSIRRIDSSGNMTASHSFILAPWFVRTELRQEGSYSGLFSNRLTKLDLVWPDWVPGEMSDHPDVQHVQKILLSITKYVS